MSAPQAQDPIVKCFPFNYKNKNQLELHYILSHKSAFNILLYFNLSHYTLLLEVFTNYIPTTKCMEKYERGAFECLEFEAEAH